MPDWEAETDASIASHGAMHGQPPLPVLKFEQLGHLVGVAARGADIDDVSDVSMCCQILIEWCQQVGRTAHLVGEGLGFSDDLGR